MSHEKNDGWNLLMLADDAYRVVLDRRKKEERAARLKEKGRIKTVVAGQRARFEEAISADELEMLVQHNIGFRYGHRDKGHGLLGAHVVVAVSTDDLLFLEFQNKADGPIWLVKQGGRLGSGKTGVDFDQASHVTFVKPSGLWQLILETIGERRYDSKWRHSDEGVEV